MSYYMPNHVDLIDVRGPSQMEPVARREAGARSAERERGSEAHAGFRHGPPSRPRRARGRDGDNHRRQSIGFLTLRLFVFRYFHRSDCCIVYCTHETVATQIPYCSIVGLVHRKGVLRVQCARSAMNRESNKNGVKSVKTHVSCR